MSLAATAVALGALNQAHPAGLTRGLEITAACVAVLCAAGTVYVTVLIWRMHSPRNVEHHLATHPAHKSEPIIGAWQEPAAAPESRPRSQPGPLQPSSPHTSPGR